MKAFFLLVTLSFLLLVVSRSQAQIAANEISKQEILETVEHIERLAADQKKALEHAQSDYLECKGQRDWWEADDAVQVTAKNREHEARVQAERERDSLIWIFALACGMAALSSFRSALQVIAMPWQLVALGGVFVGGFALGFLLGRYALHFLSAFTPHFPF